MSSRKKTVIGIAACLALGLEGFAAAPNLVINEVMSNPDPYAANPFGFDDDVLGRFISADWIEIYNPGDSAVPLAGLYLSDDCDFPDRWEIPAKANLEAPAKGFVVIWCPGYYRGYKNCAADPDMDYVPCPNEIPLYMAPFRIASEGEWIGLYANTGTEQNPVLTLIDGLQTLSMPHDKTVGCYPDGDKNSRRYLERPTIGTGLPPYHRMSGAANAQSIDLPPVIEVRSYRAEKVDGDCVTYGLRVAAGDRVRVRAWVRDLDDPDPTDGDNYIQVVRLFWKLTGAGIVRPIEMALDPHDPEKALYQGYIEAQPDKSVVEFHVYAKDKAGNEGYAYPSPITQEGYKYPVGDRGTSSAKLLINEVLAANAGCPDYEEGEVQDPVQPSCQTGGRDVGENQDRQQANDWVELFNAGTQALDLNNLYLTNNELDPISRRVHLATAKGHHVNVDATGKLPANNEMLIWCDDEVFQNDSVGFHAPFALNAREDEIILIEYRDSDSDGDPEVFVILDAICWGPGEEYDGSPRHYLSGQDPDWSIGRYPDGADNWGRMKPTPGTAPYLPGGSNTDLVPYVNLVRFDPPNPDVDEPITFEVRTWDDKPLPPYAVVLSYANWDAPGDTSVVMVNDGTGGDKVAGDEFYTAVVNSASLSGKIRYEVKVTDSDGNALRIPASSPLAYGSFYVGIRPAQGADLVLTEVVAANRDCGCAGTTPEPGCEQAGLDNHGQADDWVEVWNPTGQTIVLDRYFLTDRLDWLTRWQFPPLHLGPGERIIVWCDNELDQQPLDNSHLHARFLLDAGGDQIILVANRGVLVADVRPQVVSVLDFGNQVQVDDISFGRDAVSGEVGMLLQPTLGEPNVSLAANVEWITEMGDQLDPKELPAGSQVTVTGKALNQTQRVFIVDPIRPVCGGRGVTDWDFRGVDTPVVEPVWSLQGQELKVTLPANLIEGPHLLCVLSRYNETWFAGGVPWTRIEFSSKAGGPVFVRGDSNRDGSMNIADAVYILQNLFAQGPPLLCLDSADSNDDESVNIADAVYILQHLFASGPPIPQPYPKCGADETGHPMGGPNLPACSYPPEKCPK